MSTAQPTVDRSRPPLPGPIGSFDFPAFSSVRLANGLWVLVARMPRVPLVSLQALIPAGGQFDAHDLPGLASLHGSLLDEGTASKTSLEIAGLAENLGGSLNSGAGWNMAYVEVGLLSRHQAAGLEMLAEMIRSPAFPPEEIERARQQRQAEILRRKGHPASLAERYFAAAVYRGTVYGNPLVGTEESLERIDRDSLLAFWRRHVVPEGSALIAVGDIDPEDTIALIERELGTWPRDAPPAPQTIEPATIEHTEVHIVDRPGSTQTQLQLGHASVPRNHPDFPQMTLLNAIFGGKFTSRINLNLREKHGFTYGAQSQFARRRGPGPFNVRAAVASDVAGAAVEQLLIEMRRIRRQPISRQELEETRDYLIGVFPYTLQTISDLAKRLEAIAIFDLPEDYYDIFPANLAKVSEDQILDAARQYFDPDHLVIVAVGSAEELTPQLETFGPVHVHQP